MSARSTRFDAGSIAAAGGAAAALLSAGSTGVQAGTVAAAGAVTCILTRTLATWSTLWPGMADAVVRDGGRVRLERVHVSSRGRERDVRRVVTLPS
jgi:hypothetical protein